MKKFITIALAVAVLFSFAACQAEYKQVTGITVSYNGGDVLKGQALDQSQFTGTVTYLSAPDAAYNGGYVIAKSATETAMTYAAGANLVVPASAATSQDARVVISGATVYAYVPEEIVIDVTGATTKTMAAVTGGTDKPVSLDGVTVKVIYNGGKEMELDASYITATVDASSVAAATEVSVDLGSDWKTVWGTPVVTKVGEWNVAVEIQETVGATIDSITVAKAKDADGTEVQFWYGDNAFDASKYVVTASGKTEDGKPATWTLSADEYKIYAPSGVDSSNKFNTTTKTTLTFQAKDNVKAVNTLEVTPSDYLLAIRVADPNCEPVTAVQHDGGVVPTLGISSGTANHLEIRLASAPETWVDDEDSEYTPYYSVPFLNKYSAASTSQIVTISVDGEQGKPVSCELTYNLNKVE